MKTLGDALVMAPKFMVELPGSKNVLLSIFSRANSPRYKVTRVENHIFIEMSQGKDEWWSPQLHLEISRIDESRSVLFGWYAPRSVLWNILLFLQLAAGTLAVSFTVWASVNLVGKSDPTLPLFLMLAVIPVWMVLYFVRKAGKSRGRPFIYGFYEFLNNRVILN